MIDKKPKMINTLIMLIKRINDSVESIAIHMKNNNNDNLPVDDCEDFYILGRPIKTKIGNCRFVKVYEYPDFSNFFKLLTLQKFELINMYSSVIPSLINEKEIKQLKTLIFKLEKMSFIEIIKNNFENLRTSYLEMFKFCFNDFSEIDYNLMTEEDFEYYRELIIKINNLPIRKANPNPEIEEFIQLESLLNKSNLLTFKGVYTSVWAYTGNKPSKMYIYELYELFHRVSQMKAYDTTTLFRTVSSELQIEEWYKDNIKEEPETTTLEELQSKSGGF